MPRNEPDYVCSDCGRNVGKFHLVAKRAAFKEVGKGGTTLRTRTVSWLCTLDKEDGSKGCLFSDEDWNQPAYAAAPGMKDTGIGKDFAEQQEAARAEA